MWGTRILDFGCTERIWNFLFMPIRVGRLIAKGTCLVMSGVKLRGFLYCHPGSGVVQGYVKAGLILRIFLVFSKSVGRTHKGWCFSTPFPDNWQCAAAENDNFGESAYCPSERVIKSLSQYAGVSMETFSKFHLRSTNESDALYGKWCGMPAPPEYEHPYGGVVGARVFWEDHNGRFGLCHPPYLLMGFAISFEKHQEHLPQQFKNVILTSDCFCQVNILTSTHMMQPEQQWRNLLFSNASYFVSTQIPVVWDLQSFQSVLSFAGQPPNPRRQGEVSDKRTQSEE